MHSRYDSSQSPHASMTTTAQSQGIRRRGRGLFSFGIRERRLCYCCRRSAMRLIFLAGLLVYALISVLLQWNHSFIALQQEAPLDHLQATILKPWYALFCPNMPLLPKASNKRPDQTQSHQYLNMPPMIMMSGRPSSQVQPIVDSWNQLRDTFVVIPSTNTNNE